MTINGVPFTARKGELIIAAAERAGVYIPRFCYHPRMRAGRACAGSAWSRSTAAAARRCSRRACSRWRPDMKIETESATAKRAQEGMLELLLANHPLDCPVCDKGGECPLQDQAFSHGPGESRYVEAKRNFEKPIPVSELVLLDRERCILCDRCTRFADEVAGDKLIHFIGRGNLTQVNDLPRRAVRLVLLGQHRADLPGRRADRQAVPVQGPPVGPRAGRVDLHDVLGRLPDLGPVEPRPAVALSGRRHRRRLGQLGLAVRPRSVQLRGRRVARALVGRLADGARPSRASSRPRGAAAMAIAKQLIDEAPTIGVLGGARSTNEGALRVGASRRRPRRRVPRRPTRRRSAGRAARSSPRHDRRGCQRRHGDPARARHQGRAAGAVPAAPRRRGAQARPGSSSSRRTTTGMTRVRLAQRALPARSRRAPRSPRALADADVADAARQRRGRGRRRARQPRRVRGSAVVDACAPCSTPSPEHACCRRCAAATWSAPCTSVSRPADADHDGAGHAARRRRRQARPAGAARRRPDQRLPRCRPRPPRRSAGAADHLDRHVPVRLDAAGRPRAGGRRRSASRRHHDQHRGSRADRRPDGHGPRHVAARLDDRRRAGA